MESIVINFGLPLTYILIAITAILAVAFPLFFIFKDLKKAKASLIGVLALVVVYVICYALGSTATLDGFEEISGGTMRFIDGSLYVVYILLAVTLLAAVYSAIAGTFKK